MALPSSKTLSGRLLRRVILLSGISMLGVSVAIGVNFAGARQRAHTELRETGFGGAHAVEEFFIVLRSDLNAAASLLSADARPDEILKSVLQSHSAVHEVCVVDRIGKSVYRWRRPDGGSAAEIDDDDAALAIDGVGLYVGPVRFPEVGAPRVSIGVPLHRNGALSGALLAHVDLTEPWAAAAQLRLGERGYSYLAQDNGTVIAAGELDSKRSAKTASRPSISPRVVALGETEYYRGLRGDQVIGYAIPLKTVPWFIVVEQPASEALGEAAVQSALLLGVLLIAGLVVVGIVRFTRRRFIVPLQRMQEGVVMLAEGRLDHRIDLPEGDELGDLAAAFNNHSARLEKTIGALESQVEELRRAEEALAQRAEDLARNREALRSQTQILESILNSIGDGVAVSDLQGNLVLINPAAQKMMGLPSEMLRAEEWQSTYRFFLPDGVTPHPLEDLPLMRAVRGENVNRAELLLRRVDGTQDIWLTVNARPLLGKAGLQGGVCVFSDVTEAKATETALRRDHLELERRVDERTRELQDAHRQLVDTAHRAGMAEIATNILHNVGNVLNSVNASAAEISDRVRHSRVQMLSRVTELLDQHANDLPNFLATDARGVQLRQYIAKLGEFLIQDRESVLQEIDRLNRNIDHIKTIVSLQQSYAGVSGIVERVPLSELIDDAHRINEAGFERLRIEVVREYEPLPPIGVEKHKVLQILINLISNAKHALAESDCPEKRLALRLQRASAGRFRVQVSDNGIGIPRENLENVFRLGFSSRRDGHGFGLHGSILAARQMDGTLVAESDGPGHGATFTLELPARDPH